MVQRLAYPAFLLSLVGALLFWVFEDSVPFLMKYEGTVVRAYSNDTRNTTSGQIDSMFMLEIQTNNGRLDVEVTQPVMSQARPGMSVKKKRFSSRVILGP